MIKQVHRKISEDIEHLSNTINQPDLIDNYRTIPSKTAKYSFQVLTKYLPRWEQEWKDLKEHKAISWCVGFVHYLDYDGGFMGA